MSNKLERVLIKRLPGSDPAFLPAFLGDGNGNVRASGRMVYARLASNGDIIEVLNKRVTNDHNRRVWLGFDKTSPRTLQVLSTRELDNADDNEDETGDVPPHHETHEFPASDSVFLKIEQITWLLVFPTGGMVTHFYGGPLRIGNSLLHLPEEDVDLTSYVPATGARWVTFQITSAGALEILEGSVYGRYTDLTISRIPLEAGKFAICAVRLDNTQTELSRVPSEDGVNDFYDMRFSGYAISGGDFDLAATIHAAEHVLIPGDEDEFAVVDVANGNQLKNVQWQNIRMSLDENAETLLSQAGQQLGLLVAEAHAFWAGPSDGVEMETPAYRWIVIDDLPSRVARRTASIYPPSASDDSSGGHREGDTWVCTETGMAYICVNAAVDEAEWTPIPTKHKYRQFAWSDDGSGGWEFISADGEPVLHLQSLE